MRLSISIVGLMKDDKYDDNTKPPRTERRNWTELN